MQAFEFFGLPGIAFLDLALFLLETALHLRADLLDAARLRLALALHLGLCGGARVFDLGLQTLRLGELLAHLRDIVRIHRNHVVEEILLVVPVELLGAGGRGDAERGGPGEREGAKVEGLEAQKGHGCSPYCVRRTWRDAPRPGTPDAARRGIGAAEAALLR